MRQNVAHRHYNALNAGWLVWLRWVSIIGQLAIAAIATTFLNLDLPFLPFLVSSLTIIISNSFLHWHVKKVETLPTYVLGPVLVLDTLILTYLLYWTGGPMNPFSILYLVHITLAAVVLGTTWTWGLTLLSSLCFFVLFYKSIPIQFINQSQHHDHFSFHLDGMLGAFVTCAVLIAYFLTKVTKELHYKDQALLKLERERLKEEKLVSIATLAAGAAHELSTPLSTIAVAAGDLHFSTNKEMLQESSLVIQKEVKRCSGIIQKMREGASDHHKLEEITIELILENINCNVGPNIWSRLLIHQEIDSVSLFLPTTGLIQSLGSLIKNAYDASDNLSKIKLVCSENNDTISFSVSDTGRGITSDKMNLIKDPFYTSKEPGKGMGLGLFLVDRFVSKHHGKLEITSEIEIGTTVTLSLPKINLEREGTYD